MALTTTRLTLLLTILLLSCPLSSALGREKKGSSKDIMHLSLPVSSHEEDMLLLQMFPRQTYNITSNVVLTFPVSTTTDMAVALLLLGHTPSRRIFKCWLIVEARAVRQHSLKLDIKYLSVNGSQVHEPTITLQLDEMQRQQEVTIYFQPSKRSMTIFLDCRQLITRDIHLRKPNGKRYSQSVMQLLEVSEQVVQMATPTARLRPEVDVLCTFLWADRNRKLSTRQLPELLKPKTPPPLLSNFGEWTSWTEWSTCSASCGLGKHSRERLCRPPSHMLNQRSFVLDCEGDRLQARFCSHKWKCQPSPTSLPQKRIGDVTCQAYHNGTVNRFVGDHINIRPDCAHVLVDDCGIRNDKLRIFAVWEACTGATARCIVSVVVDDVDIGQILVTKEHHVYVNGEPTDFFTTVARPTGIKYKLIIVLDSCGVRLVGVRGYDVCYNGSASNVTVVLHTDSFVRLTCGLCGPSQHVERLMSSTKSMEEPTISNSRNRPTGHARTPHSSSNETFKLKSWYCKGCNTDGPNDAVIRAQLDCGIGFYSKEFEVCKQRLSSNEFNRLANRCQSRMCRCPSSHKRECLCKALSELAVTCGKNGVAVSWRNANFCPKRCNSVTKEYKDWGCSITCRDYVNGTLPSNCPAEKYTSGCHCRFSNWILLSGGLERSNCIPPFFCPCQTEKGLISHGISIEERRRNCTCTSGLLKCGPPIVDGSSQVLYGRKGSPFIVQCKTTDNAQTTKVNLVDPRGRVSVGNGRAKFVIRALDVSHGVGMYVCTAVNSVGSTKARIEVKLAVPPRIKAITPPQTLPEYSPDVTINCELDRDPVPKPTISWSVNGERLTADGKNVVLKEISKKSVFRLKISELRRNYSGNYCCNASSVGGSSTLCTLMTVVLSDSGQLRFLSKPKDVSVVTGGAVRLQCVAIGDPYPHHVEWLHDGRPVSKLANIVGKKRLKLVIKRVDQSKSGTYECRVHSANSTIRTSSVVTVYDVDGWSFWSLWSSCSATCGKHAISVRHRRCMKSPCQVSGASVERRQCGSQQCPSTCYTWGNLHLVTFSGQNVSLQSGCNRNILAQDCRNLRKPLFYVQYVTKRCHSSEVDSCAKEVQIFLGNQKTEYILDGHTVMNVAKRKKNIVFPYHSTKGSVFITYDGVFITFRTDGLTVRYDGRSRVYVEIDQRFRSTTSGLCTLDEIHDFELCSETSRSAVNDTQRGKSRSRNGGLSLCRTRPLQESACSAEDEAKSREYCSPLLDDHRFTPCHDVLHPLEFYQQCRRLVCKCSQQAATSDCTCGAYGNYVTLCSQLGIQLSWSNKSACYSKCGITASKIMTECRPLEQATCFSKSSKGRNRNTRVSRCHQNSSIGCHCPEGTVWHNDRCIYKTDCSCSHQDNQQFAGDSAIWTDKCTSSGTCSHRTAQKTNSSCNEDMYVVVTTPNTLAFVEGKTFQLCCDLVNPLDKLRSPTRYRWFHNGVPIQGERRSSTIQSRAGSYSCKVEGSSFISKESSVNMYSNARSICDASLSDRWILLPSDCQHAVTGARRINVGQCSRLSCITRTHDTTTSPTSHNTHFCCGVSKWTFVNVSCPRSSLSSFRVPKVSECGCTSCVQHKASVFGTATWENDGSPVKHGAVQSLDGLLAGDILDGHYELNVSFNLRYLLLKFESFRGDNSRQYFSPIVRVLPVSPGYDIVHHMQVLSPTHSQQVDCRSSSVISLSNVDGRSNLFALQTSLMIGRESFRYKNGSVCSSFVNFRIIYADALRSDIAAESPGVFDYTDSDDTSALIKPLFVLMLSAVDENNEFVEIIRPVRFYLHSPLQNIFTSTDDSQSVPEDGTTSQLELFVLSDWSAVWKPYSDDRAVRRMSNRRDSATGFLPYHAPAFAVGRKVKMCYARVGTIDVVGNGIGGIEVIVSTLYDPPYMTSTSKWLTDESGEICVPFACNYKAIITVVQTINSQPVCLFPSAMSNANTNISYHKDGAIHLLPTAPDRPPLHRSLYACQLSSTEDGHFLFVTPEFVSSFIAVEKTASLSPHYAAASLVPEPFYFVKVRIMSSLGRQYTVRASTFVFVSDGYQLHGWRQQLVTITRDRKSFVCVESPVPRRALSNGDNVVVLVDVNSVMETGEGRNVCRRQWFSPHLHSSKLSMNDTTDYEFKFLLPAVEYGRTSGVYTDFKRLRAEIDCLNSLPQRASEAQKTRNAETLTTAAVSFSCS